MLQLFQPTKVYDHTTIRVDYEPGVVRGGDVPDLSLIRHGENGINVASTSLPFN